MKTALQILDDMITHTMTKPNDVRTDAQVAILKEAKELIQKETNQNYESMPNSTEALTDFLNRNGEKMVPPIQKETGWISVEDMLPNKFDNIILLCEHSVEKPTRKKYEIGFRDDEYFYTKSQERLIFWKVTHWMPLPLPPHK